MNAHPNIALIKYWGKRDEALFLPTKSSISVALTSFTTTTTIAPADSYNDTLIINNTTADGEEKQKVTRFLDLFRKRYAITDHVVVTSHNSFPTAAGLASSASGFAALTKALNNFYNLGLSSKELSTLARMGSGSACRSIHDGFVLWHKGTCSADSYAEQLFTDDHWPELRVLVAVIDSNKKAISSRTAMQQTVATSPNYNAWVKRSQTRIPAMIDAIKRKDFHAVGTLAEIDCLEMHHCIQTTTPHINYWQQGTKKVMKQVKALRDRGIPCYFTIDAGPNVKILTLEKQIDEIARKGFFCYTLALAR